METRTVRVEASSKSAAIEKGRLVLDHYKPDTIDLSVEEIPEAKTAR